MRRRQLNFRQPPRLEKFFVKKRKVPELLSYKWESFGPVKKNVQNFKKKIKISEKVQNFKKSSKFPKKKFKISKKKV